MYTQAEKPKGNQRESAAQKKGNVNQEIGFVDNQPEAIQMRQWQEISNYGPSAINAIQLKNTDKSIPTARRVQLYVKEQMPCFYQKQKEERYQELKNPNKMNGAFQPDRSIQQTTQLQAIQKAQSHATGCGCASCHPQWVQRKAFRSTTIMQMMCNAGQRNYPKELRYANNPEYSIQLVAVKRDNFSKDQRLKILKKNAKKNNGFHTCKFCGFQHKLVTYATYKGKRLGDGGFQIDHVKPASKGGRALIRNSQVLCGTCNTSKGNRAVIGKTGLKKYSGLHRKSVSKDYKNKRS